MPTMMSGGILPSPIRRVGSFVRLPVDSDVCRGRIEQVLSVVEIKNGIAPAFVFPIAVSRRQPDSQHAGIAENPAVKFMQPQLTGRRDRRRSRVAG